MSGPLPPVLPSHSGSEPGEEVEDGQSLDLARLSSDSFKSLVPATEHLQPKAVPVRKFARHTIGIFCLLVTVFLWTVSNFLASTIFADNTYAKPYFVTYVNSSFFALFLIHAGIKRYRINGKSARDIFRDQGPSTLYVAVPEDDENAQSKVQEDTPESERLAPPAALTVDDSMTSVTASDSPQLPHLSVRETAWLSFEFCLLWFFANYFVAACLEYTTVASSTILASTSSIFTLIFGSMLKVEAFTIRKLIGCVMSLAGIILISSVDLIGNSDKNRGDFPHKSHKELAIGDVLALASAVMYGIYTTVMKKRIGDEGRIDMILFFGFVGLFNLVTLLPGFFVVHFLNIERFELPPTKWIITIVLVNSITSLVADVAWAYAMLLTSPLVVTVGLSLSIPLSLFGQMIVNGQTSSVMYWIGAAIVLVSFIFINHQSKDKSSRNGDHNTDQNDHTGPWSFAWRIWDRIKKSMFGKIAG